MKAQYRVIEPYESPFSDPLEVDAGTKLQFERRETEWEGWLWCTAPSGKTCWAPESWLTLEEGACTLKRDYSARELSAEVGELITADFIESDWVYGSTAAGEQGWIPLNHLAPAVQEGAAYQLTDADQAQMLGKLMLYWDGQWFLKTVEAFGLEAAIDLNARVRTSFGRIEMRTLLKVVGKTGADDLPDAMHLLETYSRAFLRGRLRAEFTVLDGDRAQVIVSRCAAFEGAKLAALPRQDQACVACETLWNAWFETLLPGVEWDVEYPMRQGKGDPVCKFVVTARGPGERS